jgi:hypothetical protein
MFQIAYRRSLIAAFGRARAIWGSSRRFEPLYRESYLIVIFSMSHKEHDPL